MRTLAHPFADFARTTRKDKMSRDQASTYHVTASPLGLEPRPLLRQASAFIILTSQIHLIMFGHWLTISSLYKGVSNYHSVGNFPAWFVTCRTWFTPSSSHRVTWWVFVRKSETLNWPGDRRSMLSSDQNVGKFWPNNYVNETVWEFVGWCFKFYFLFFYSDLCPVALPLIVTADKCNYPKDLETEKKKTISEYSLVCTVIFIPGWPSFSQLLTCLCLILSPFCSFVQTSSHGIIYSLFVCQFPSLFFFTGKRHGDHPNWNDGQRASMHS